MDPDANLKEQIEIAENILDDDSASNLPEKARRLAELVQALDEWITKGGFLPAVWRK